MHAYAPVSIHLVTPASASLLERLDEDVFDHAVRPELLRQFLAQPSNLLVVAVVDGEVIGMATALTYVHLDKPLSMFINEVGVSGRFHRRGVAQRLVAAVLHQARELGCHEAWVATELSNAPARALYRSAGGIEDEERAVVYVYPLTNGTKANEGSCG